MGKHVKVNTTEEQRVLALQIAEERNNPKEIMGIKRPFWDGRSGIASHQRGVLGEVIVADYLGARMNREVSLRGSHWDIELPCECRGEIKTRDRRGWDFALPSNDVKDIENCWIQILVWCLNYPWTMCIVGYIYKPEFIKHAQTVNYGHGDRLAVRSGRFHSIDHLKNPQLAHGPECSRFIKPDGIQGVLWERT